MSVQRSPPSASFSSQPDLSKLNELAVESQITFRSKRKERPTDCDCTIEIKQIHSELSRIGSLLEKYVESNEQIIKNMQESITEVKSQISELKVCNEQTNQLIRQNTTQINEIKSSTSNVAKEQHELRQNVLKLEKQICHDEHKIVTLESDISALKHSSPLQPVTSKTNNQLYSNEQLIKEVTDRNYREKNIIIVGLSETTTSTGEGSSSDEKNVCEIISRVCQDLPKPTKIFRIGKYTPGKNRSIKVCFTSSDTAKYLLRNKDRLPQNIKIFSDQTPAQQQYLKSLKDELLRRQNDGEDQLTIKYIHGVPTIVKQPPKNFI